VNGAPLLDTHAWVSWVEHDGRLDPRTLDAIDSLPPDARPYLCDISLWEVAMLVELKRLALDIPLEEWLAASSHPRSVRLIAITPVIAAETAVLPSTFHRDPADRLIVATCRVMGLSLLTSDRRILRSRLVSRWKPAAP
jgi:PIN domain nuclease of toxin-antitoxin system